MRTKRFGGCEAQGAVLFVMRAMRRNVCDTHRAPCAMRLRSARRAVHRNIAHADPLVKAPRAPRTDAAARGPAGAARRHLAEAARDGAAALPRRQVRRAGGDRRGRARPGHLRRGPGAPARARCRLVWAARRRPVQDAAPVGRLLHNVWGDAVWRVKCRPCSTPACALAGDGSKRVHAPVPDCRRPPPAAARAALRAPGFAQSITQF